MYGKRRENRWGRTGKGSGRKGKERKRKGIVALSVEMIGTSLD